MLKELQYPFDSEQILQSRRKLRNKLKGDGSTRLKKRIAVLGGSTTNDIIGCLELFLLNVGIEAEFYTSEYNQYYNDAMFGNAELDNFTPDIVFIHTTSRNLSVPWPTVNDSADVINDRLKEQMAYYTNMWAKVRERFNCPIIQNNFEMPYFRLLGNKDGQDVHGRVNFVLRLNQLFAEYASEATDFYINDINYMSALYGIERWSDPFAWYMYKYAMAIPAIPEFALNLANIIKSLFGRNKKVLALDLDNTLWGGVVGDDGVNGIEIGQETPMGQAYHEFQSYIKAHKDIGVLLTVCSKNDMENAVAGLNHPSGVLRPEDMTLIKANWNAKSLNINETAQELTLLPESIVFVDDNPAEREIVCSYVDGAAVPDINKVEDYIKVIDRSGFFEITTFSADDAKRNEMYRANLERAKASEIYTNYDEYLESLEMKACIRDFEPVYLARITQLTNKSNQFNLTTKRYTESEMEAITDDAGYIRLYGRLIDKFGDNGIVSVVIGKINDKRELHIDLWLMSCRVLKRGMEQAMLDMLVSECSNKGIRDIYGYYYPTAKNNMVRELYAEFGFTLLSKDDEGNTVWRLATEGYVNKNKFIKVFREEKELL